LLNCVSSEPGAGQTDRILIDVISQIVGLSLSQIEETFCDAVGMHLFGASYAFAFHYLLAPSLGGTRAIQYPPLSVRAQNIEGLAGLDFNQIGLSNYSAEFRDRQPSLTQPDTFIVLAADEIAQQMATSTYQLAKQTVTSKAPQFVPERAAQDEILAMFRHGVPANAPRSMSDILNAGWMYVTQQKDTFDESDRSLIEWASELILKSLEVLEYRTRTSHA
jgi:hypothetical protein